MFTRREALKAAGASAIAVATGTPLLAGQQCTSWKGIDPAPGIPQWLVDLDPEFIHDVAAAVATSLDEKLLNDQATRHMQRAFDDKPLESKAVRIYPIDEQNWTIWYYPKWTWISVDSEFTPEVRDDIDYRLQRIAALSMFRHIREQMIQPVRGPNRDGLPVWIHDIDERGLLPCARPIEDGNVLAWANRFHDKLMIRSSITFDPAKGAMIAVDAMFGLHQPTGSATAEFSFPEALRMQPNV